MLSAPVELFCNKKEVLYMFMPKTGKVVLKRQELLRGAGQFPYSDFMGETFQVVICCFKCIFLFPG